MASERILVFPSHGENGEELVSGLDRLARVAGLQVDVADDSLNRFTAWAAARSARLAVFDCSDDRALRVFSELAKQASSTLLVSRQTLPANVRAGYHCAPRYGEKLDNEQILTWLERNLGALLAGEPIEPAEPEWAEQVAVTPQLRSVSWPSPFVSHRGTHRPAAEQAGRTNEAEAGARIVPVGQYAYENECLPLQRMWEIVAELSSEMARSRRVIIVDSPDYLDSFWTTSELLSLVWHRGRNRAGPLPDVSVVPASDPSAEPQPLGPGIEPLSRALLTPDAARRFHRILNNTDPETAAPDARLAPRGLNRLVAPLLRRLTGHHDPEFTSDHWWRDVWVPCPACGPSGRRADDVDWTYHLRFWLGSGGHYRDRATTDGYFGYFAVAPEQLHGTVATASCPSCTQAVRLDRLGQDRRYWAPVHTTEADQDRSPELALPVWVARPADAA